MVAVMAAIMLKSHVTLWASLGIGIIALAAGTSMFFAPKEQMSTFDTPRDFFTDPIIVYLVVSVAVWLFVGYTIWRERRHARLDSPQAALRAGYPAVLRALRIPLLNAWVMTVGHLFNSGLG